MLTASYINDQLKSKNVNVSHEILIYSVLFLGSEKSSRRVLYDPSAPYFILSPFKVIYRCFAKLPNHDLFIYQRFYIVKNWSGFFTSSYFFWRGNSNIFSFTMVATNKSYPLKASHVPNTFNTNSFFHRSA